MFFEYLVWNTIESLITLTHAWCNRNPSENSSPCLASNHISTFIWMERGTTESIGTTFDHMHPSLRLLLENTVRDRIACFRLSYPNLSFSMYQLWNSWIATYLWVNHPLLPILSIGLCLSDFCFDNQVRLLSLGFFTPSKCGVYL